MTCRLLLMCALLAATSPCSVGGVSSGPLSASFGADGAVSVAIAGHGTATALPPAAFIRGRMHALGNGTMSCAAPTQRDGGNDAFGAYASVTLNCTAGVHQTPIRYSVKAYAGAVGGQSPMPPGDGLLLFDVELPRGAAGLQMRPVDTSDWSPPQFAPFPAFDASSGPLADAVAMCFGSQRPHMFARPGVSALDARCTTLAGGMTVLGWPDAGSGTTVAGAVVTAANEFHLNFNRLSSQAAGWHARADRPAAGEGSWGVSSGGTAAGPSSRPVWSHGLSGEISSVPKGFVGRTMLYYSGAGINAAVDGWGTTLRVAYNSTKQDAEDVFLQTVSLWSDNGATSDGTAWHSEEAPPPAPHGVFNTINWPMVGESALGGVMDSVSSTGVAVRATQMDCWWYPVGTRLPVPDWCGVDWVPPKTVFPKGMAGVRERLGTPLMLYLPAVCAVDPRNGTTRWDGQYRWSNTSALGWVLPVADQAEAFYDDLFSFGTDTSGAAASLGPGSDPWPGRWAPPMVKAAWSGTNMAAYETDFFSDLEALTPEARTQYGKGGALLRGMDAAARRRNLTVQICGGTVPDFLKALTLPSITQARAGVDYDGESPVPGFSDGMHNFAAADSGWPFWGTRMGLSKDNFWTTYRNLSDVSFTTKTRGAGHNAEVHAVVAGLTGVVGLGDWGRNMTNGTLLRRLARADGVLLKADRPLAPMDLMVTAIINASRTLPLTQEGARAWSTHVTVAVESPDAPEVSPVPTRRLVSHTMRDSTRFLRVPQALERHAHFLQWLVVGINTTRTPFGVCGSDLYPAPGDHQQLAVRSFYQAPCLDGSDPFAPGGCLTLQVNASDTLFDIAAGAAPCPAPGLCQHAMTIHSVFALPRGADHPVLLGDLAAYASLSGHRFRLSRTAVEAGRTDSIVVVGQPEEVVPVTYLAPDPRTSSGWIAHVRSVTIGSDGRQEMAMTAAGGVASGNTTASEPVRLPPVAGPPGEDES